MFGMSSAETPSFVRAETRRRLPERLTPKVNHADPTLPSVFPACVHPDTLLHMKFIVATVLAFFLPAEHTWSADAPRAARSVHLAFTGAEGDLFYNECVVEKSTDGSYFMVCGWDTGYFGVQQLRGDRKVAIFSVWDPIKGDNPSEVKTEDRVEVLFEGAGARIKRFGGEGTGGQCMIDFAWKVGETNRFAIRGITETNGVRKTSYTAFLHNHETGAWTRLATFRVRTKNEGLRGLYSFIEDFRRDTKSVGDLRRARFGNAWTRTHGGDWKPIAKARFTASSAEWESKENIDAGVADDWFYLATGGEIRASRELRSVIELPERPRELPPAARAVD
jgi:hypothetical protein